MKLPLWILEALVACLCIGIGLLSLLKPKLWYELSESWKSYRPEEAAPGYLLLIRIGGGLLTAFGLFLAVMAVKSLLS